MTQFIAILTNSMSINVWGNLAKAQDDPEKIEEAIARIIEEHNDDPEAHLGENQSLQSHKASEIIDHLAHSIITDKVAKGEIKPFNLGFMSFSSIFESIDGYTKSSNVYYDEDIGALLLITGSTSYDFEYIRKRVMSLPGSFSWDKNRVFRTAVMFQSTGNLLATILASSEFEEDEPHIGFRIIGSTLYGVVSDGANESTVNLGTFSNNVYKHLKFEYFAGEKVDFYVDNVLVDTIEDNLPSGSVLSDLIFSVFLRTQINSSKFIHIPYFDFRQEE